MSKKLTQEEFIKRVKKVHGDFYNYDKVNYIGYHTKVKINCPEHGDFDQTPKQHLKGCNCNKCVNDKKTKTTEEFILDARKVHGDFYNYDKVNYIGAHIDVKINCPEHGDFDQTPNNHLKGCDCDKCANEKFPSYLYKSNLDQITNLYLISLESNSELFLKVGISKNIKKRIREIKREGYNVKLLKSKEGVGFDIVEFEKYFLQYYSKFKYTPKIEFTGYTECLDISLLKELPNDNWYITN